jgi:hypothetical protein
VRHDVRKAATFDLRLPDQRAKEVALVYAREAAVDVARPAREVVRHGDGGGGAHRGGDVGAALTKPLEKHVAAQGESGEQDRRLWQLTRQALDGELEIRRLTGVIEAPGVVHLATAGPEDECSG